MYAKNNAIPTKLFLLLEKFEGFALRVGYGEIFFEEA
jgi:hypothetical protein